MNSLTLVRRFLSLVFCFSLMIFLLLSSKSHAGTHDNWYRVMGLYKDILDRTTAEINTDMIGINYWTQYLDNGQISLSQLESILRSSNEYYVRQLYKTELRRTGDTGGIYYWTAQLDGGLSRAALQSQFQSICANRINGECAPVQTYSPTSYTCQLQAMSCKANTDGNYSFGFYSCSNGAKILVSAADSQAACKSSYTFREAPTNNNSYWYNPLVGF